MADKADETNSNSSNDPSNNANNCSQRKNSYVWDYFRKVKGTSSSYECCVCNSCVSNNPSNLARHLSNSHGILKPSESLENLSRGRPCHSFIWKYCTKDDSKHVRCHLCNKVLFFGSGNTSNITKHLRRRHQDVLDKREFAGRRYNMDEATANVEQTTGISAGDGKTAGTINGITLKTEFASPPLPGATSATATSETAQERRERKGGSYVWQYCEKLSRHTIRCKLCQKVMSFHGTANVITHLQRKHNILGKGDEIGATQDTTPSTKTGTEASGDEQQRERQQPEDADPNDTSYKSSRVSISSSIVWKYCTRIGKDIVRCSFCKKTLSYQGTSNLQRHLHRMHGVVTHGRLASKDAAEEQRYLEANSNFIWDHCNRLLDETKTKCNMCSAIFDSDDVDNIIKHLTVTHSVQPRRQGRKRKRRQISDDEFSSDGYVDDFDNDATWNNNDDDSYEPDAVIKKIKKDDSFYDEIIEEDHEDQTNYDEDPFDASMAHDVPLANPLSPPSSNDGDREGPPTAKHQKMNIFPSKKMQKLQEDRVRTETEYFREKAGFYRMQKYLTALQAKKMRIELEHLNVAVDGGGGGVAMNGSTAGDLQYAMVDVHNTSVHN